MYTARTLASLAYVARQRGNFDECFRCADLSIQLMKTLNCIQGNCRSNSNYLYASILVSVTGGYIPLRKTLQDTLEPFMEAYRHGIQAGNVEYGLIAGICYAYVYTMVGLPRSRHVASDMECFGKDARNFGLSPSIQIMFPIFQQASMNLMGQYKEHVLLNGEAMKEEEVLAGLQGNAQKMTFRDICVMKLMLAVVYRDLDMAESMIDKLAEFPVSNPMVARMHLRQSFTGLAAFVLANDINDKDSKRCAATRRKFRSIDTESLNYFKTAVKNGSLNAYSIYLLLEAELAPSRKKYDEAIRVCSRSGHKNFEAIACEACGLWLLNQTKDDDWATHYVSQAFDRYTEWEAFGKVKLISRTYPFLAPSAMISLEGFGGHIHGKKVHNVNIVDMTKVVCINSLA